jgi:hypothetical protein
MPERVENERANFRELECFAVLLLQTGRLDVS